jgi:L-arabinose isomerase
VEQWNAEGPAHHCAIGRGKLASRIKKLAAILDIHTVQIC